MGITPAAEQALSGPRGWVLYLLKRVAAEGTPVRARVNRSGSVVIAIDGKPETDVRRAAIRMQKMLGMP